MAMQIDKELVQLYAEQDRLQSLITSLRNEHNFLVNDIDRLNKEKVELLRQKKEFLEGIDKERVLLENDKQSFERYKSEQENIIKKTITDEKDRLCKKIDEEKILIQELDKKQSDHNSAVLLFEKEKQLKEEEFRRSYRDLQELNNTNTEKIQFISSELSKLEAQKERVALDTIEAEKKIKEAQEILEQSKINVEIEKSERERLSILKQEFDKQEKELIEKSQELVRKENNLNEREENILKLETEIKDKKKKLEDKEYNLLTKEADLKIEEKRLVLASKQQKGA